MALREGSGVGAARCSGGLMRAAGRRAAGVLDRGWLAHGPETCLPRGMVSERSKPIGARALVRN